MTCLWRIFSSLLLVPVAWCATVQGTVRLSNSRDRKVQKKADYSGVVVWLEPVASASSVPSKALTVKMEQRDKRFVPHVLAIQEGTTVDFPNFDPIFHNAFSNFSGQPFDVGLYAPGTTRKVKFRRNGIVRVFCNIHPTMSAVIVVLKTPNSAVSQSNGKYSLANVPSGEYRLSVFHERATEATLKALERHVRIDSDALLPEIAVSEVGYLEVPHKNKYGKDYPAVIEDTPIYPGKKR